MIRMMAAISVAAMALPSAVPAEAQTRQYYMRERIVGLRASSPAYPGKWQSSTTQGSCVGGKRTTTVTSSCLGGACDPTTDPAGTTQSDCTFSCTGWTSGTFPSGGYASTPSPGYVRYSGLADMYAKAQAACASYAGSGVVTSCVAQPISGTSTPIANVYVGFGSGTRNQGGYYTSSCS